MRKNAIGDAFFIVLIERNLNSIYSDRKYRLDSEFMFLVTFHEFLNPSLHDREQYANKKDLKSAPRC